MCAGRESLSTVQIENVPRYDGSLSSRTVLCLPSVDGVQLYVHAVVR